MPTKPKFYRHHNRVEGVPLEWCPYFDYCADCHNGTEFKYVRAHCLRCAALLADEDFELVIMPSGVWVRMCARMGRLGIDISECYPRDIIATIFQFLAHEYGTADDRGVE